MFRKMKTKICSNLGESISETLIALLISSLALVMLAAAISSSSAMITTSRNKLKDYYDKEVVFVNRSAGITTGSPSVTIADATASPSDGRTVQSQKFSVIYYENDEFSNMPVIAYKKSG